MDIRGMVKKLRAAADTLEALFEGPGTPAIARKIDKELSTRGRGGKKGHVYPKGTHWTQKPENKARLKKLAKKMMATKRAMKKQG